MLNINLIVGGWVAAGWDTRNKYLMKILLNNPPGCDWRTCEALYGIDSMKSIDHGMLQPLPSFGSSRAQSCFAIVNRNSHENDPVTRRRRPKRTPTESGAIAAFRKERHPFTNKNIIRENRGLKSFAFGITICCCTDNQDQDRFERISE